MSLTTILEELPSLKTPELKRIVIAANKLMKQPKLYLREIGKTDAGKQYFYLYATWQEDGKTRQKSLGRKVDGAVEEEFGRFGISSRQSAEFLRQMQANGYRIVASS